MDRQPVSPHSPGRWQRFGLWALVATSIASATLLIDHLAHLKSRVAEVETARVREELELRQDLFGLRAFMGDLKARLDESATRIESATALRERLGRTERELGRFGARVEAQASDLQRIEGAYAGFGPETLRAELTQRDERIDSRWQSLSELVSSVKEAAAVNLEEMERLEQDLQAQRDLTRMWRELMGPVVQLAGDMSVGSGVRLHSRFDAEKGRFQTQLLTAWHVVRDIQGDLEHTDLPVPVFIYRESGDVRREEATLLAFDADIDVALLELETPDELPFGAALATPERLAEVRIFDQVYAVGCPLGNDPIPTHGEIATVSHRVEEETYWMINAPTYIGNSGGGIFDAEHHELVGIFSKIYTHGSLRPTIVPHMGLVTPLDVIYDWLREEGYGEIIPGATGVAGAAGETPSEGRLAAAGAPR